MLNRNTHIRICRRSKCLAELNSALIRIKFRPRINLYVFINQQFFCVTTCNTSSQTFQNVKVIHILSMRDGRNWKMKKFPLHIA